MIEVVANSTIAISVGVFGRNAFTKPTNAVCIWAYSVASMLPDPSMTKTMSIPQDSSSGGFGSGITSALTDVVKKMIGVIAVSIRTVARKLAQKFYYIYFFF